MTRFRLAGVLALALAVAPPALAQDAKAWQQRGDAALAAWDRVAAREAYEAAVAAATLAADPVPEVYARAKLAEVLLAIGDRPAAVPQYDGLTRLYVAAGDVPSASIALIHAARTLLDIDRYEEVARRAAEQARLADPDPIRRAVMAQLRVTAYVRGHQTDLARQALLETRRDLPPVVWDRYLREDAVRLGVWTDDEAPRWLVRALLALIVAVAVAAFAWRRRRVEIVMAGAACLVAVGIAEVALRVAMPPIGEVRHLLHPPSRSTTFKPEPGVMPGIDAPQTRFTTNAIGLRGRELPPPGTTRWIAVGGSSTESLFIDDDDAWPAVLERELRTRHGRDVWIGNAGKSGLTTFSHASQLLAWQDEIAPSLVIMQSGFNDMSLCVSGGRQDVLDTALRFRHPDYPTTYARFVFHEVLPPRASSRWRIEELVDRVRQRWAAHEAGTKLSERAYVVQDRAGAMYAVLRNHRQAAQKVDAAPAVDDCVRAYADNLRRIADWAAARKVRLVLLTQGSLYRSDLTPDEEKLLWFGAVDASMFSDPPAPRYFTTRVMRELLARYNATMLAVCAERRLWCYDVDQFVERSDAMYYDDAHVNVRGSRTLGSELARRLAASIDANGGY